MLNENPKIDSRWWQGLRTVLRVAVLVAIVWLIKLGVDALFAKIALFESDAAARAMTGLIITVLVGYAILLAIPFVPGVEIGFAILMVQGAPAAPIVYLATLGGLLLAFFLGQGAPLNRLISLCNDLYIFRIGGLLARIQDTPREDRLDAINARLPRWLAPILCNYRYVTLGIAINLPGNIALGGGGGIMMAAGLSRLFQTGYVVLTIMLATLPVPLAVWVMGTDILK
jgi:hypothetical protein